MPVTVFTLMFLDTCMTCFVNHVYFRTTVIHDSRFLNNNVSLFCLLNSDIQSVQKQETVTNLNDHDLDLITVSLLPFLYDL